MKHTDDTDKTEAEAVLAFYERLASSSVPTEEGEVIHAIGLGNTQARTMTPVNQAVPRGAHLNDEGTAESSTMQPLGLAADPFAVAPTPARRRRAPRQSRNHDLLGLLKELQGEPFADFIVMTRSAIESGMRCTRWRNKDLLMNELHFLCDIGCQTAGDEEGDDAECIELAMRKHENCRSFTSWGKTVALPHQHDVHDSTLDVSLRIHFSTEIESCRVIIGWIEEIRPGDHTSTADNQDTAGHNALACA